MVYKKGFILAVKDSKGKVLRDDGHKVSMQFYEEYTLILKNKNNTKAVATIFIDGEDAMFGKRAIIPALGSFEIERFVNSMNDGRKFQFVPNTDPRIKDKKNSGELGIIEIRFKKEKHVNLDMGYISINKSSTSKYRACGQSSIGGTAPGSRSDQKFSLDTIGQLETETATIRLRIVPLETGETKTVENTKNIFCCSCGKKNPYKAIYCMKCGNKLNH